MTKINIDEEMQNITDAEETVAMLRALKRMGIDYSLTQTGAQVAEVDEALVMSEEFAEVFIEELSSIASQKILDRLVEKGVLTPDRIDDDGNLEYRRLK